MPNNKIDFLTEIAKYYTTKLTEYGETSRGVDWKSEAGQLLRFEQLCKIFDTANHFSINDLGCGYGALFDFIVNKYDGLSYLGVDVSEGMIQAAERRYKDRPQARFVLSNEPSQVADFGVASGIFNVRMGRSNEEWQSYIEATLEVLDRTSRLGFAFNCLTCYADKDKIRDHLYYANPCALFDLCKRRFSRNVALLHDYGLHEFTILVRKQV
jgi:cyclopropane fatty-acyl-phospholipid synthase-like methyltransferase